jgi:multiple sugar transport system ATP-binding protein
MNLAEATLDRTDGTGLALIFGGHRVRVDPVSAQRRPRLADYVRRQVVIGVRPEHLAEASGDAPEDARLRVPVARTESAGADLFVEFVMDSPLLLEEDPRDADTEAESGEPMPPERVNLWRARIGDSAPRVGDVVELAVEPGTLHVFDPRTGEAIED